MDFESLLQPGGPSAGSSVSFTLGTASYRLLRLDTEWRQRFDEVRVPPEEAAALIEQAARQNQDSHDLALLFEAAVSHLAGLHEDGVYILLQRHTSDAPVSATAPSAPASTPSALRPPVLPDAPLPLTDEPEFGLEQAAVLKSAAATGVPFCEECARAAARRNASSAA